MLYKVIIARQKPYKTPKHLEKFGIEVCKKCGNYKSIDDTICYNCGELKEQIVVIQPFEKANK